jgi:hypothetical protein
VIEIDGQCMPDIESQVSQIFGFSVLKSCIVNCIYFISAVAWIRRVSVSNKYPLNCVMYLVVRHFMCKLQKHLKLLQLGLELFPMTLRRLSMKGCVITELDPRRSYFQKLQIAFPHIKVSRIK